MTQHRRTSCHRAREVLLWVVVGLLGAVVCVWTTWALVGVTTSLEALQ